LLLAQVVETNPTTIGHHRALTNTTSSLTPTPKGTALFSQFDPPPPFRFLSAPTASLPTIVCHRQHHFLKRLDGNKIQQQNPMCKQFLLCTTRQAPENHGCTLCCDFSTPNPVVLFQLGQQCSLPCLDVQNIEPVFGFGGIVYVGPL